MPVSAIWDNFEKTAILLSFEHPWTWHEYEIVRDSIDDSLSQSTQEIDLIIDTRYAGHIPDDALDRLSNAYAGKHLNLRRFVIVGQAEPLKKLFTIAENYYTAHGGFLDVLFVESITEARKLG